MLRTLIEKIGIFKPDDTKKTNETSSLMANNEQIPLSQTSKQYGAIETKHAKP